MIALFNLINKKGYIEMKKVKLTLTLSQETINYLNEYCDKNYENKSLLIEKFINALKKESHPGIIVLLNNILCNKGDIKDGA